MRDLVPGGYIFTHLVFWTVVGMVAVGTNAVAIILSIGLGLLAFESITKSRSYRSSRCRVGLPSQGRLSFCQRS